jgi:hypothetical protein
MNTPSPALPANLDDYSMEVAERMRHAIVREQTHATFARAKERYDSKVKLLRFTEGDLVWHYCPRNKKSLCSKWVPYCQGPYVIQKRLNDIHFVIQLLNSRRPAFVANIDRLRRFESTTKRSNPPETVISDGSAHAELTSDTSGSTSYTGPDQTVPTGVHRSQRHRLTPVGRADCPAAADEPLPNRLRPTRMRRVPSRYID